jgi:putative transposase
LTNYRRIHVPGATWFFTLNLARRRSGLLIEHIDTLRSALGYVQRRHPFLVEAMVVLPDHLHAVWTLPPGDAGYPMRWRLFKSWFSRHIPPGEQRCASRIEKGERGVWQRRYWEHMIRDDEDFQRCVDYIHINPVKHGHVTRVADWPYSSFHRYVAKGWLPEDWGVAIEPTAGFGEYGDS